jgi:colanic acid/amylovoran biosynthesis glycosyltransferase
MNIALISPSLDQYSETFINAHKEFLKGKIFFYHNGELPTMLQGKPIIYGRQKRIKHILRGYYRLNNFSIEQEALLESFQSNKIDLVFAEYGSTGETVAELCEQLKIPLIVHFHGFDAHHQNQLIAYQSYKKLFRYASYVIVVSKKMRTDLIKLGCPVEKIVYTVCGPRKEFFDITPDFSKPNFLSAGRFTDKKAPYYVILAFARVLKKLPHAKLIMAGEGELFNTCNNLIRYLRLEKNIKLVGSISPDELRKIMASSRAFIQHSLTTPEGNSEGTPVVITEAGAAGLPVIATAHAGIADVIRHNHTGLLSEEHNIDEMAANIILLASDADLAKKMGENAKEIVLRDFTMDKHIAILNSTILKALS